MEFDVTTIVTIIENTEAARAEFGYAYGADITVLTEEHIAALRAGKCLAFLDGEYSHFLILESR